MFIMNAGVMVVLAISLFNVSNVKYHIYKITTAVLPNCSPDDHTSRCIPSSVNIFSRSMGCK